MNFASTQGAIVAATAKWQANSYTVRYDANGGEGSMSNSTFTYDGANNSLKANGFTREGYRFVGWRINGTVYSAGAVAQGTNFASANGAAVTATAVWEIISDEAD